MAVFNTLINKRIHRFVEERLRPALYHSPVALQVSAWPVPDEPVPFREAVTQSFEPVAVGAQWGRPWSTVWFHVTGEVPASWGDDGGPVEVLIDLGFTTGQVGFQAEGLVYAPDGRVIKGLEPLNNYVPLDLVAGRRVDLYVEAAANPEVGDFTLFTPTPLGRKVTAGDAELYQLRRAEVARRDVAVGELLHDIWTLHGLARELSPDLPRRMEILCALDAVVDAVDPDDVRGTAAGARKMLEAVLAAPASATAHRIVAVGHAHIDSAWLWPTRETVRKCARTFANVLALMDEDPDFIFACSSAQQYRWIKDYYPQLFERIRERVREGRFVPVGGMWVESDTNLPGGEALVRQFVEGKLFFLEEFGFEPKEVWLPDSFGYTAALPQVARAAGATALLTQKLSWNEVNPFPHHTFEWEGIDGSRIFTHFPPVDTYNSKLSAEELAHAQRNFADKGVANTSLVPFGYGDGGGGPTREMMAAARRTHSLEGSPTVTVATPAEFFARARAEIGSPAVWTGELYLEFHRGTYTSQARTKQGNRRCEALLHEAELWATTASVRTGAIYPYAPLRRAWQTVLLQQFHDILPGSSIGWVADQAEENYRAVEASLEALIDDAITALSGDGADPVRFNASPYPVDGIGAHAAEPVPPDETAVDATAVAVTPHGDGFVLDNGLVRLTLDTDGLIASLVDVASGRETVPAGTLANVLQLFRDTPTQWDAWDVDQEYRRTGTDLTRADRVEIVASDVVVERRFGSSQVTQRVTLRPGSRTVEIETEVDWHERQKLLKLAFPIDVHTSEAASEIQFGHIVRPTHGNTSWDVARFETPAHRWVHVADRSFGVGIVNDSTYGHDVTRHYNGRGSTYSTVRQSLLRAPLFPDPEADQGRHRFRTGIVVGALPDAIVEGYRLRTPLRSVRGTAVRPLVRSTKPAVIVETVKLAHDGSGDVIVRLYEAHGTWAVATLSVGFPFGSVVETDLLERAVDPAAVTAVAPEAISLELNPFQLVTVRIGVAANSNSRDQEHQPT